MLSPTWGCSVNPHSTNFPLSHSEFTPPSRNSPKGLLKFTSNSNLVGQRSRSHVKSAKTEEGTDSISSKNGGGSASSFLSVLCPLLKLFGGGDPSQERNDFVEVATSSLSSLARLPWGSRSFANSISNIESTKIPPQLRLYEFEACPFCRRVREAMTELDLSVEVYPCPKGSSRHREMVRQIGGKQQYPFLVDLSTGVFMYESGDIVKYLFQQYGQGRKPSIGLLESTMLTGWVPTLLRAGRGMTAWDRACLEPPPQLLELFSYENNPYGRIHVTMHPSYLLYIFVQYGRIVREALCELELPYILHNVGEGSSRSELLFKASGANEVPYLVDPNTGFRMGDYKSILSYLFQTYSCG